MFLESPTTIRIKKFQIYNGIYVLKQNVVKNVLYLYIYIQTESIKIHKCQNFFELVLFSNVWIFPSSYFFMIKSQTEQNLLS